MKWFTLILTLISLHAVAAPPQSFDMVLTGKTEAGPNANDELFVRKMIAGFVENLKVKRYRLRSTPANGGFHVCIDPVADGGYDYIVSELSAISVRESRWDVTLIDRCP